MPFLIAIVLGLAAIAAAVVFWYVTVPTAAILASVAIYRSSRFSPVIRGRIAGGLVILAVLTGGVGAAIHLGGTGASAPPAQLAGFPTLPPTTTPTAYPAPASTQVALPPSPSEMTPTGVTSLAPDGKEPVTVAAYGLATHDGITALDVAAYRDDVHIEYQAPLQSLYDCPGSGSLADVVQGVETAAVDLHRDRRDVLGDVTGINGSGAKLGSYCGDVLGNYIDTLRAGLPWPPTASSAPPVATTSCTTTRSGSCIQGGEFCPAASEGTDGTDAAGDTYMCRDSNSNGHPHWELP